MTADPDKLSYVDVDGAEQSHLIEPVGPAPLGEHRQIGIHTRELRLVGSNDFIVQRFVVADDDADAVELSRKLDGEIIAGLRITRAFVTVAPMVPHLIGYRPDVERPYALWSGGLTGRPVREVAGRLMANELDQVTAQLFQGLCTLDGSGVVHRNLHPETVTWDGERLRLGWLDWAALTGEPRTQSGAGPWASPEQRNASGMADPRDDVWSAIMLLSYLASGEEPGTDPAQVLSRLGERFERLVPETVKPRASLRPRAGDVLTRLSIPPPPLVARPPDREFLEGSRRFDEILAAKQAARQPVWQAAPARPPKRRWWQRHAAPAPPPPTPPAFPARPCYRCLGSVSWTNQLAELYVVQGGHHVPLDLTGVTEVTQVEDLLLSAFVRCPHSVRQQEAHFLPVRYLRSGHPLNIGVVGKSASGKTHLLAGMMREIELGALNRVGLQTTAVDIAWNADFRAQHVRVLYERSETLPATVVTEGVDFSFGYLMSDGRTQRPVMFFDVAGEDLSPAASQQTRQATRHLAIADAFMFMVDADPSTVDPTYGAVLDRIARRVGTDGLLDAHGIVVVTKADLLRFQAPADRWIRQLDYAVPQRRAQLLAESRDVYAYLYRQGRFQLLDPFAKCRHSSLHFVSATGSNSRGNRFPAGARPLRCLEPLISLLIISGILPPPASASEEGS